MLDQALLAQAHPNPQSAPQSVATIQPPTLSLPKGGGAIKGIGETFTTNPVTGTGTVSVPMPLSPGRAGFGPQLALTYDSGAGNGPFGFGWSLTLPAITRKTETGLPRYQDGSDQQPDSDLFLLANTDDLVPSLQHDESGMLVLVAGQPVLADQERTVDAVRYRVRQYQPRIEGLFARIERWTRADGDVHWRSLSKDNLLTIYGYDASARIADPHHPAHIYSWLISEIRDAQGNAILYEYKPEDGAGIDLAMAHECNRGAPTDLARTANRYLKRIRYGNETTLLDQNNQRPFHLSPAQRSTTHWLFELVFDYGEHHANTPAPNDQGSWSMRTDPFSSYRAGFEVRTTRLCQRILMFHHVAEIPEVGLNCLVRSLNLQYASTEAPDTSQTPVYARLAALSQYGYQRTANGGYLAKSMPPLEFEYSLPHVQERVETVDPASLAHLPIGIDGQAYQWVDLHGEGIPGVLSEQAGAWFYTRNHSPLSPGMVTLAAPETVQQLPITRLANGAQLHDLAGDGQLDLVTFENHMPGLYEHDQAEGWQPFRPLTDRLNHDLRDPNLRFVDLTGDGQADLLFSTDTGFTWHASLAEAGFGPAQSIPAPRDEAHGPRLVFADGSQSIYLADMCGDGLADLVRVRNGEVCYWPNLGYGRFGAKVTMDNAPWFDQPDQFDQQRIRLADLDGTGTTDLIYLHRDGVRLYLNQSGNRWASVYQLTVFPQVDNLVQISTADLLGNGTSCLVWSSPLAGDRQQQVRYVNLVGSQKPHLLVRIRNNLGAETEIQYSTSTRFYLADKLAGTPWLSKLPFPVHVVERIILTDKWRGTRFSTSYSYHHGAYDGEEREFRGFGRIEQVDVEEYGIFQRGNAASPYITDDQRLYQPPVKTVTWYHTGLAAGHESLQTQYRHEYFPAWYEAQLAGQPLPGDFHERALPEPIRMPDGLAPAEWREAMRASKGLLLRQEIYELDLDALVQGQQHPVRLFSASERGYSLQPVQPRASNQHAIFLPLECETISYEYELDLRSPVLTRDPRVSHTLNLRYDRYGQIEQTVTVGYPRWQASVIDDQLLGDDVRTLINHVQHALHMAYVETHYTNPIQDATSYRLPAACEVQSYELGGLSLASAGDGHYLSLEKLNTFRLSERYQATGISVTPIQYHEILTQASPQKRLVEHSRMLFFNEQLDQPLPFGTQNGLALAYETYTLALTDALLAAVFGPDRTAELLTTLQTPALSGYMSGVTLGTRLGNDTAGQYWRCSGVAGFNADAQQHFFLPERYSDPFGNLTLLEYDARDLFVRSSTDALGNRTELLAFDYRVLAARQLRDPNGTISEIGFDILGTPALMAVRGSQGEGDTLAGIPDALLNPSRSDLVAFFVTNDYDPARAQQLLGSATTRHLYYFGETLEQGNLRWNQHPPCSAGIAREQHASLQPLSPVLTTFEYSDGTGTGLVKKIPAEPEQPDGRLRWVASGKTMLNNKGKPVMQYEPYFSPAATGHRYEEPQQIGVTPVLYYDAAGRLIRTEAPDGSYSRVVFSPWQVARYDANDTLAEADNAWLLRMQASPDPADQHAAALALEHANTPILVYFDSLGREVVTITHNRANGSDQKLVSFTKLDAEGKPLWVQDARGNRVMQYVTPMLAAGSQRYDDPPNLTPQNLTPGYDLAGSLLLQHSMDAGTRWTLNDSEGKPLYTWNARGFRTRTSYDRLQRLVAVFVQASGNTSLDGTPRNPASPPDAEVLVERHVYGEQHPDSSANLRGKLFRVYDNLGVTTSVRYDFKGNLLLSNRRFARVYKTLPDWSALAGIAALDQLPALAEPLLESSPPLIMQMSYDALNRPSSLTTPDASQYRPFFNAANLLERVDVALRGANTATAFVTNIDYNARGQRTLIAYANGATSTYSYEPLTFRLATLRSTRPAQADITASLLFSSPTLVQDLHYTYDPVGNLTQIEDRSLQSSPHARTTCTYRYDALYRLVAASGREHTGQNGFAALPGDGNQRDIPFAGARIHPNDLQGLQDYVEQYRYDPVGNLLQLIHASGSDIDQPGQTVWQRRYQYALDSNRLLATSLPGDPDNLPDYVAVPGYSARYHSDQHGNSVAMPHLPTMRWNYRDQLSASAQQVVNNGTPETTYYVYDATGQRARKITETQAGTRKNERRYLGSYETYREYSNDTLVLERETVHVMDDQQRIALVETQILPTISQPRVRYQLANQLGSASVELDQDGALVSYEEYHPYGTTAFQAGRSAAEVSLKRYRYTAKERDHETGFGYHGARYYAPWLARWISADPIGIGDGLNLYRYCSNQPIMLHDPTGQAGQADTSRDPKYKDPHAMTLDEYRKINAKRANPLPDDVVVRQYNRDHRKAAAPGASKQGSGPGSQDQTKKGQKDGAAVGDKHGTKTGEGNQNRSGDPAGNSDRNQAGNPNEKVGGQSKDGSGTQVAGAPPGQQGGVGQPGGKSQSTWEQLVLAAGFINNLKAPDYTEKDKGSPDGIPDGYGSHGSKIGQAIYLIVAAVAIIMTAKTVFQSAAKQAAARMAGDQIIKREAAALGVEEMVKVSRWGRPGLQTGDWVMKGGTTWSNYLRSFKFEPSWKFLGKNANIPTPYTAGEEFLVPKSTVRWPWSKGWEAWKGVFGQRVYTGPNMPSPNP